MWSARLKPIQEKPAKKKMTTEEHSPFATRRVEITKLKIMIEKYLDSLMTTNQHLPNTLKKEGVHDYASADALKYRLLDEEQEIAYQELSEIEQQALLRQYRSLFLINCGYVPCPATTTLEEVTTELLKLSKKIPHFVTVALARKLSKKFRNNEFEKELEQTSKLVVEVGVAALSSYLTTIKEQEGILPTVLIFPETATRPLVYAIAPLIEKVYADAHQPLPRRVFVKTHRDTRHFEELRSEVETAYQELLTEKTKLIEERAHILQAFHASGSRSDELMKKIHDLTEKIAAIKKTWTDHASSHKSFQKETKSTFRLAIQEPVEHRIAEIMTDSPDGPYLVIEDLLSEGETLSSIHRAAMAEHKHGETYFFTFFTLKPENPRTCSIPNNHLYTGISQDPNIPSHKTTRDPDLNTIPHEWGEFAHRGFPYRYDSTQKTRELLVTKTHRHFEPYTSPAPNSDHAAARALRLKYRSWGEEALSKLKKSE